MGPFFGFPPLKNSRSLHKAIRVERVENIPQLVRKPVNRVSISSDSSDTWTGGYIQLAFLQLTFFNKMLTLFNFMYTCMENTRKFMPKLYAALLPSQDMRPEIAV
jgi:hypothetical protein